eukprot:579380-Pelagomonas_calceolata.AAC.6
MLDAILGEVIVTCEKIHWLCNEGERWLKPEKRSSGILSFYKAARVEYHPVGVVGAGATSQLTFYDLAYLAIVLCLLGWGTTLGVVGSGALRDDLAGAGQAGDVKEESAACAFLPSCPPKSGVLVQSVQPVPNLDLDDPQACKTVYMAAGRCHRALELPLPQCHQPFDVMRLLGQRLGDQGRGSGQGISSRTATRMRPRRAAHLLSAPTQHQG